MVRPEYLQTVSRSRQKVSSFVEGRACTRLLTTLIVINAITLGLETEQSITQRIGSWLYAIDRLILIVFSIEMLLKLYAYRWHFFRSGWNVFDFMIVAISWIPATGVFSVFRALRVLRILRLLSVVPQMRRVIAALGHSIPGMASVVSVLLLLFYVAAVLATKLFGSHPSANMQEWFGSIGDSAYTLFQIMTLESWSMGIVRPTMEIFPWAWLFFVPFIIVTSFAVLNLFIGIIVDAMQTAQKSPREEDKSALKAFTREEIDALHTEIAILSRKMDELKGLLPRNSQ